MMFQEDAGHDPALQYGQCRKLCRKLSAIVTPFDYAGRQVRVHSIHWSEEPPESEAVVHRHSFYEAILTVSGRARETTGSRQDLTQGTLQLHPPATPHGWISPQTGITRLGISLSIHPRVPFGKKTHWPRKAEALAELSALFQEVDTDSAARGERVRARLLLFLGHFFDLLDWPRENREAPGEDGVWSLSETVNRFLADNFNQPLSLDDVATMAAVSVATLTRRYRQETGISIMERLNRLRMEAAAGYLGETGMLVEEIAARTGFSDPSYFCRCFRHFFRQTPGEYRTAKAAHRSPTATARGGPFP